MRTINLKDELNVEAHRELFKYFHGLDFDKYRARWEVRQTLKIMGPASTLCEHEQRAKKALGMCLERLYSL